MGIMFYWLHKVFPLITYCQYSIVQMRTREKCLLPNRCAFFDDIMNQNELTTIALMKWEEFALT